MNQEKNLYEEESTDNTQELTRRLLINDIYWTRSK